MVKDTVREELETKIERISGPLRRSVIKFEEPVDGPDSLNDSPPETPSAEQKKDIAPVLPPAPARITTSDLPRKNTSPTLVDFQTKNPTLPDWRLQIQNSVRRRIDKGSHAFSAASPEPAPVAADPAGTAYAGVSPKLNENKGQNPMVANALRRIEESRKAYMPAAAVSNPTPNRTYPFNVIVRNDRVAADRPEPSPRPASVPKPRLISSLKIEKKKYDTNRLQRLPETSEDLLPSEPSELPLADVSAETVGAAKPESLSSIDHPFPESAETEDQITAAAEAAEEEYDDIAPFSMRFGAGLFDMVLGAVGALILLSPFMAGSGNWLSLFGGLAFLAALSIIVFLYLTASLSLWGKSFGMRLFSLELIDAEQSSYPTVHQAAVNSAVYLLSLAFFGAGFLTLLFNEEKRAFHDIISGTILIRYIA